MTWWWEGMCWGMKSEVGRELWYEPSDFRFNRWDCTFHPTYNVLCSCLVVKLPPALLWPHGLQPTRLLCPWNFPGKDTTADCHFLPQGIFLTQGSNLHLPHCRRILYHWATILQSMAKISCLYHRHSGNLLLVWYFSLGDKRWIQVSSALIRIFRSRDKNGYSRAWISVF